MLPLDVQGELLISFQEERRRQRLLQAAAADNAVPRRARLFGALGVRLVRLGEGLQRAAGSPATARLGEVGR
jgi:hypothetical protein